MAWVRSELHRLRRFQEANLSLKYLHENGCHWLQYTTQCAAENGHLECLKYAHENGCPWSEYTCSLASARGHLECLKYCRDNGCPE
jgi:hypothetical protein